MNLSSIQSEVQTFLMNTSADANSLSWTPTELASYINEAVLYTQQITGYFQDFANIVCTASVSTYTAPARVYQFHRFTWDRNFLPQTNEYELDKNDPSWRAAPPNNPFRFYFPTFQQSYTVAPYPTPSQNGNQFAPFSSEFGVVAEFTLADGVTPDPTYKFTQETGIVIGFSDTNGAIIRFQADVIANPFTTVSQELGELVWFSTDKLNIGIIFTPIPDTLVNSTDSPQLPNDCHYALVFYALMKCFMREGEFQDAQLAQAWFSAYADWMEAVLEVQKRRWPTRVKSYEPFEEGSLFAKAMNSIGYPMQLDLKPSYGA